ncbi:tyrosine recombinase XerC [Nostoc sp.]|uniref:site-specific integrase n=1 Tax=Nostoc sp. TaxID=1180 RepID=UPI003594014E
MTRPGSIEVSEDYRKVGIEDDDGTVRFRRQYQKKRYEFRVGKANKPGVWELAADKAEWVDRDIAARTFDTSKKKYFPERAAYAVPELEERKQVAPKLDQLWEQHEKFKWNQVSVTTREITFVNVASHIKKLPTKKLEEAIAIRDYLIKNNSPYRTKRILTQLNACCKWALKSGLITKNPFAEMASEIRVIKSQTDDGPEHFSEEDQNTIIDAYENHPQLNHYASIVKFWFWTGSRTSEAIGLRWKDINDECTIITFSEVTVNVSSRKIRKDTKTHKSRKFKCNPRLQNLLKSIKPENCTEDMIVFPAVKGGEINAHYFNACIWNECETKKGERIGLVRKLANEGKIEKYLPQYNTRHTFITLCLEKNIPDKDIARWVGNSRAVVNQSYAGHNAYLEVPET